MLSTDNLKYLDEQNVSKPEQMSNISKKKKLKRKKNKTKTELLKCKCVSRTSKTHKKLNGLTTLHYEMRGH